MKTAPPQSELRLTPVERHPLPPERRTAFDPVRFLVDIKRSPQFWFGLFLLALGCLLFERVFASARCAGDVVVVDTAGNLHDGKLLSFREAKALHLQQASLATQAFLNRTPTDFDNPELLELLFSPTAFVKAKADFAQESPERLAKQIHQKAVIDKIDLLQTRDDQLLVDLTGQLLRTGNFLDQPFSEGLPFRLRFKMSRNPNLALSGRVPTIVTDYKYATNN